MSTNNVSWFKSSFSVQDEYCVEVCFDEDSVRVRSSRNVNGPVLVFDRGEWTAFELGVSHGEFVMPI